MTVNCHVTRDGLPVELTRLETIENDVMVPRAVCTKEAKRLKPLEPSAQDTTQITRDFRADGSSVVTKYVCVRVCAKYVQLCRAMYVRWILWIFDWQEMVLADRITYKPKFFLWSVRVLRVRLNASGFGGWFGRGQSVYMAWVSVVNFWWVWSIVIALDTHCAQTWIHIIWQETTNEKWWTRALNIV